MKSIALEIASTEPLPENFYKAHDSIYPDQRNRTLAKWTLLSVWYLILDIDELKSLKHCNCIWASNFFPNNEMRFHSFNSLIIAHGIEKFTTEARCLDFAYRKIEIEKNAFEHFSKPLNDLTIEENVELIIYATNPVLYKKHPELLKDKLEKISKPVYNINPTN